MYFFVMNDAKTYRVDRTPFGYNEIETKGYSSVLKELIDISYPTIDKATITITPTVRYLYHTELEPITYRQVEEFYADILEITFPGESESEKLFYGTYIDAKQAGCKFGKLKEFYELVINLGKSTRYHNRLKKKYPQLLKFFEYYYGNINGENNIRSGILNKAQCIFIGAELIQPLTVGVTDDLLIDYRT